MTFTSTIKPLSSPIKQKGKETMRQRLEIGLSINIGVRPVDTCKIDVKEMAL